jgi:hypothetical protein
MTTFAELAEKSKQVQFKQGDLCHVELPVKDLARAKKFYGEIFGWQFQDVPEMDYTLFITPSGQLGGGFFTPNEHMPARVVNYLSVASIEETVAKIVEHGGSAISPVIEVPNHGKLIHVLDSEGTVFALWQV